jgi:hypothetical protein
MIGLVNIWSTTRKIVSTIGDAGKWIGGGPSGPSGTTCICWTIVARLGSNKGGILTCSKKGTILVACLSIKLGCTLQGFWGWSPK